MLSRPQLRAFHQGFTVQLPQERPNLPRFTRPARSSPIGPIITHIETTRRQPGILDNLLNAKSHHDACAIWESFLALNPTPSDKTINRAMKLLTAHMENRIS